MHTSHLYETDFYGWTQEQITLLKAQQWDRLDTINLFLYALTDNLFKPHFLNPLSHLQLVVLEHYGEHTTRRL